MEFTDKFLVTCKACGGATEVVWGRSATVVIESEGGQIYNEMESDSAIFKVTCACGNAATEYL